ncbi:hypothetical protein FRB94_002551 [Tulasnella sp. JGI-2019a]|nr:hypothetical protein FRB93_010200 [Tulasnella sp. JGI-2019a]KAG9013476.1 hypothetical protein FRB94_002551 [Tulasnella sp. JGI-2019a]
MWCDNCLLLLPLRAGAIAWAAIIVIYSVAGGIFLFKYGPFLFFFYPEWDIYGGIAMTVGALALINAIALSSRSYIWTRVCKFSWPFLVVISAIRAIVMIVQLYRYQWNIVWECENGGQMWGSVTETGDPATTTMPNTICDPGWHTLFMIFIFALVIDLVFQIYMLFLNWRFSKRLEHYNSMKGPFHGGYYNA